VISINYNKFEKKLRLTVWKKGFYLKIREISFILNPNNESLPISLIENLKEILGFSSTVEKIAQEIMYRTSYRFV
jgi:hypothetical protein